MWISRARGLVLPCPLDEILCGGQPRAAFQQMEKIAKFEKVSLDLFVKAYVEEFGCSQEQAVRAYRNIKLPVRATAGSAGYDFFSTAAIVLAVGQSVKIPTGVRAKIKDGWVLQIFPRSGLGFKYRVQLDNTVGIIDSDYYFGDNEGHIFIKITNDGKQGKPVELKDGTGFAQGVFLPFGITEDDAADAQRHGGFGSTGNC